MMSYSPTLRSIHTIQQDAEMVASTQQEKAMQAIQECAARHAITFKLETGDMMFANNMALLHSRTRFSDPVADLQVGRCMLRLWLSDASGGEAIPVELRDAWNAAFSAERRGYRDVYDFSPLSKSEVSQGMQASTTGVYRLDQSNGARPPATATFEDSSKTDEEEEDEEEDEEADKPEEGEDVDANGTTKDEAEEQEESDQSEGEGQQQEDKTNETEDEDEDEEEEEQYSDNDSGAEPTVPMMGGTGGDRGSGERRGTRC